MVFLNTNQAKLRGRSNFPPFEWNDMAFKDIFVNAPAKTAPEVPEQVVGRIYHINKRGFGFIECKEIPHERIYFHWKALNHDTKRFAELVKGDEVEFTPKKYDEKKGWQAQRIKVLT